jgi:hypothetical protein
LGGTLRHYSICPELFREELSIKQEIIHQKNKVKVLLYSDFHNRNIWSSLTVFFFVFRRLLTVLLIIFWSDPIYQVFVLALMSLMNLTFLTGIKPYATKALNRAEIFNELTVLVNFYIYLMYIGEQYDRGQKYSAGWISISNIFLNLLINLASFIINTFVSWYHQL